MNLRKTAAAACTQTFITPARQMFMLHLKIPSNECHGFQKRGLDARKLWKNIHLLKKGLFLTHLSPAFPCPFWTPFSVFVLCNSNTLHKQTDGRMYVRWSSSWAIVLKDVVGVFWSFPRRLWSSLLKSAHGKRRGNDPKGSHLSKHGWTPL